ncbi:MAG: GNAT family N-acetyltransferase [Bacteroidales bacterium]|nr:GNAT family N-acetyltransferase [Lachnoclostridium sp.]MCM1383098.1 GNAT family N-acetyltransferase [Lachnoclostridium sp.]MCM1465410.1 GNAT family N-acetyltransferase [Bacteroidales bacterium]
MDVEQKYRDEEAGIFLRPMTYADTDFVVKWRNQDAVRKNFVYQELFTKESHENWIRTQVETGQAIQMIICLADNNVPVGAVNIQHIDREHRKAEYGVFIGEESARGRGIGTAAAKLMLRYCFEEEKLHRVYLRALAGNAAAIRSYEKAGFAHEGYLKEDVRIGEEYIDLVWMAVLNPAESGV